MNTDNLQKEICNYVACLTNSTDGSIYEFSVLLQYSEKDKSFYIKDIKLSEVLKG